MEHFLLQNALPNLARELTTLLVQHRRSDLAEQIPSLKIVDLCRCRDEFCAMFFTVPKPERSWGADHQCIDLEPDRGMLVLDVVDGKITAVECLYRPEIRAELLRLFP